MNVNKNKVFTRHVFDEIMSKYPLYKVFNERVFNLTLPPNYNVIKSQDYSDIQTIFYVHNFFDKYSLPYDPKQSDADIKECINKIPTLLQTVENSAGDFNAFNLVKKQINGFNCLKIVDVDTFLFWLKSSFLVRTWFNNVFTTYFSNKKMLEKCFQELKPYIMTNFSSYTDNNEVYLPIDPLPKGQLSENLFKFIESVMNIITTTFNPLRLEENSFYPSQILQRIRDSNNLPIDGTKYSLFLNVGFYHNPLSQDSKKYIFVYGNPDEKSEYFGYPYNDINSLSGIQPILDAIIKNDVDPATGQSGSFIGPSQSVSLNGNDHYKDFMNKIMDYPILTNDHVFYYDEWFEEIKDDVVNLKSQGLLTEEIVNFLFRVIEKYIDDTQWDENDDIVDIIFNIDEKFVNYNDKNNVKCLVYYDYCMITSDKSNDRGYLDKTHTHAIFEKGRTVLDDILTKLDSTDKLSQFDAKYILSIYQVTQSYISSYVKKDKTISIGGGGQGIDLESILKYLEKIKGRIEPHIPDLKKIAGQNVSIADKTKAVTHKTVTGKVKIADNNLDTRESNSADNNPEIVHGNVNIAAPINAKEPVTATGENPMVPKIAVIEFYGIKLPIQKDVIISNNKATS